MSGPAEGIYELHWQRREYGQLTIQLYGREADGQMRLVDTYEQGPFEQDHNVIQWVLRRLALDLSPPHR